MPRLTVTFEKNRLPEIKAKFPNEVKEIIKEEGLTFEDGVVENIVKYGVIDTGTLLNSVAFDGEAEAADNVEYGEYQDKGTAFISPRPFWSDELAVSRKRFPKRFNDIERRIL